MRIAFWSYLSVITILLATPTIELLHR